MCLHSRESYILTTATTYTQYLYSILRHHFTLTNLPKYIWFCQFYKDIYEFQMHWNAVHVKKRWEAPTDCWVILCKYLGVSGWYWKWKVCNKSIRWCCWSRRGLLRLHPCMGQRGRTNRSLTVLWWEGRNEMEALCWVRRHPRWFVHSETKTARMKVIFLI